MRIGIDYLPAVTHAPGVGRYARELVRALVQLEERPDLALFEVGRTPRVIDEAALGLSIGDRHVARLRRNVSRRLLPLFARVGPWSADRWLGGVDLFHHVLRVPPPVARARQMLALSELPAPGSLAESALRPVLARMDDVLVFSSAYAEALPVRFGIAPGRVHKVAVGCEHWRRELQALPAPDAPPTLLVLGALRPERRHKSVLEAFEVLRARGIDARLLLLGRRGPAAADFERALASSPAREHVTWRADAHERELPALVARASVLVHLSDDEGTPVTPLEAFAVGVAAVTSRIAAFAEALGGLELAVDNDEAVREPARLADALARALASSADEAARTARMLHARQFTWERNARETCAVWSRVLA